VAAAVPLVYQIFILYPPWVLYRPWTLVTYMFLHAGFMHLAFNMLGLYFFGPALERRIGSRDFILLYLMSGATGAVLSFMLIPFTGPVAIVGASGAVFGVLLGFARYWPDQPIYLMMVLPIPARALVIGLAALSLFSGFSGAASGVAHFAHLGGFLGGWGYLRLRDRRSQRFKRRVRERKIF